MRETYSLPESIKRSETEWGGKIVSSQGSSHSRGVVILFKPRLDVDFGKITADNFGTCIFAETIIDGTKMFLMNIYAPNDGTQQRDVDLSLVRHNWEKRLYKTLPANPQHTKRLSISTRYSSR